MNKIAIGTVQFGLPYGISNVNGQTPQEEVVKILSLAQNAGIDLLDTASTYGNAEEVLGNIELSNFKIVSKFIPPPHNETIIDQLDNSLKKLNISSIYGYLAHRPMSLISEPKYWEELKELKKRGLVNKIGFSLNMPSELDALLDKKFVPDLVQVPFNYFDQRFEKHLLRLRENGCEIHTRSVFLQGLFFMKDENLNPYFNKVKPILKFIQASTNDLAGSLLNFVLEKTFIDYVIVGIENSNQLTSNLNGVNSASKLPIINQIIDDCILMPSCWPKK